MRPAHFLESLTDTYCPGRFAIKTTTPPAEVDRQKWIEDQADLVVAYCSEIYEQGQQELVGAYELLIADLKRDDALSDSDKLCAEIFDRIKNASYPYIYISAADIRGTLKAHRQRWDALMLAPRDHMSTIADPKVLREYYIEQCRELLLHGYPLEAGLSVVPMPVTYAIERSAVPKITTARKSLLEAIQSFFPVPNLSEVEDSVVDGRYKRRDESTVVNREYPLFNSAFWESYKDYLRSGKWKLDLQHPYPGTSSSAVREKLLKYQDKARENGRFVTSERHNIVAPRHVGPEPSIEPARAESRDPALPSREPGGAARQDIDRPKIEQRSNEFRHAYQTPKPLSYFDALRTDFSLSRLSHYTATSPEFFQKNILTINYPGYARQFILKAMAEIYRQKGGAQGSKLVITAAKRSEHPGGQVLAYQEVVEFFKKGDGGADDPGLKNLELVVTAFQKHVAVDELPQDDERSIAYRACRYLVGEKLMNSPDAQMPAYHFIPASSDEVTREMDKPATAYLEKIFEVTDLPGITMIDIGVGPSNAKTITDHLAPLRPRCWIMVGRCGGLRRHQHVGDYVFATSYARRDGILDRYVPLDAPVKTTRAIVTAFDKAIEHILRADIQKVEEEIKQTRSSLPNRISRVLRFREGDLTQEQQEARFHALRRIVRIGTVISTGDRNWETAPTDELFEEFAKYRAVGIDMESGALAANGYRYRVHHGALLCVSDKPLHGSVRMRLLEDEFYSRQTARHLDIVISALRWLEYNFTSAALLQHSRELRGADDPPWR